MTNKQWTSKVQPLYFSIRCLDSSEFLFLETYWNKLTQKYAFAYMHCTADACRYAQDILKSCLQHVEIMLPFILWSKEDSWHYIFTDKETWVTSLTTSLSHTLSTAVWFEFILVPSVHPCTMSLSWPRSIPVPWVYHDLGPSLYHEFITT